MRSSKATIKQSLIVANKYIVEIYDYACAITIPNQWFDAFTLII